MDGWMDGYMNGQPKNRMSAAMVTAGAEANVYMYGGSNPYRSVQTCTATLGCEMP